MLASQCGKKDARSAIEWAVSDVGWQFIPGAALTGFIVLAVVTAWTSQASKSRQTAVKTVIGIAIALTGVWMTGQLLIGEGNAVGNSIGLPTEENLKGLKKWGAINLSATPFPYP